MSKFRQMSPLWIGIIPFGHSRFFFKARSYKKKCLLLFEALFPELHFMLHYGIIKLQVVNGYTNVSKNKKDVAFSIASKLCLEEYLMLIEKTTILKKKKKSKSYKVDSNVQFPTYYPSKEILNH